MSPSPDRRTPLTYYPEVSDLASELGLDDLQAAGHRTREVLEWLADYDRDRVVLYGYGPPEGGAGDHYYLVYDHGRHHQGRAPFVGVHLHIEPGHTELRAEMREQPLPPLAENWLAGQGADRDRLRRLAGEVFLPLGDSESTKIEALLGKSGKRFKIHYSHSSRAGDRFVTYAIATDRTPPDPSKPVTVFVSFRTGESTSRLRGATFSSREAATEWIRGIETPLLPSARDRAEAARLDSRPDAATQPGTEAAPASSEADRPRPHRR
ncbi:hypothetical protein HUT16_17610 [Kitasatospora sp. NA04385]|uniref:hypothetical protein n=1 Tax=Kitasatospora sp. NA04385 TaxID=2742135 RepID=UPI00158FCD5F|nr:hypothetical protein [Kitasatospora sp. NA04385]QKW20645.1 hypothetical protein HUT16_17610 [Kitasatospora sp. NA04385]